MFTNQDLALNNLNWLIYHKTKPHQIKLNMKQLQNSSEEIKLKFHTA